MGLDVAARKIIFCVTAKTSSNGRELVPQIIKELCQSIIRENQDDEFYGKPCLMTTPDYVLYLEFVSCFQKNNITMLRKKDSEIMLGHPSDDHPVPLSAVTDALACTIDRDATLMLGGNDLPPSVPETFRPGKNRPSRSTVKHEYDKTVPPSIEFCASCLGMFTYKKLMPCTRCKFPAYCSKHCQTVDWNGKHRRMCKHLALVTEVGGFPETG